MKETQSNNTYFKKISLKSLTVTNETVRKLDGGSRRENELRSIDGRTPFFALKSGSSDPIVQSSRISGVSGVRPASRPDIVERALGIVMPYIRGDQDYVDWEMKYYPYRFSSRSLRMPYSKIAEKTVYPYFINAQQPLSARAGKAIEEALPIGESSIRKVIPKGSLRLLSYEDAAHDLPATTNWGMPYMISGTVVSQGKVEQDNRPLYINLAKKIGKGNLSKSLIMDNAFISIGRGQESNDLKDTIDGQVVPKQRRPGAEGHAGTILGNRMKPFLEKRKRDPRRAALVSQSAVDQRIHSAFQTLKSDQGMLAGDGSSYDTWMNPDVAKRICSVIMDSFTMPDVDRVACESYFDHVFSDPLITPEGLLGGPHGMPSGTTFTNELDSCYNELLSIAVGKLDSSINKLGISLDMVADQGDDAVMVMNVQSKDITIQQLAESISELYKELNMSVNPKKQMISKTKTEFLKRLHKKDVLQSYRSYVGTTIGLCNLEHSKAWKYPMYSARYIMQCANHYSNLPGFDAFMKFVSEGDEELHIGVGIEGGAYSIFQKAGGVDTVLKRLDMTAYATHLGVEHSTGEAKLASSLSSADGVAKQNHKRG